MDSSNNIEKFTGEVTSEVSEQLAEQLAEQTDIMTGSNKWATWFKIISFTFLTLGGAAIGYAYSLGQDSERLNNRITNIVATVNDNESEIDALAFEQEEIKDDQRELREIVLGFKAEVLAELSNIDQNINRLYRREYGSRNHNFNGLEIESIE